MNNFTFYKDEQGREEFELAFMQHFMLYNGELNNQIAGEKKGFANVGSAYRIRAAIDPSRLEKCIQRVYDENPMTRILAVDKGDGRYMQKIITNYTFKLDVIEAQGATEQEKFDYGVEYATKVMQSYLDPFTGISNKIFLIKLADDDFFFTIVTHHWIGDGASLGAIFGSIFKYYIDLNAPAVPAGSFIEYIDEEREFKNSDAGKKQLAYWADEFAGYEKIDLENKISVLGNDHSNIDRKYTVDIRKVEEISAANKTSNFQVILMAYHIALSMITGVGDISIGATSACRTAKYMATVGFFAHSAFHRLKVSDSDKLTELLKNSVKIHSKAMSAIRTSFDYYENLQFNIAYQNYIPASSTKKQAFELEDIPISSVREVNVFYLCPFERKDDLLIMMIGSGKLFPREFRDMMDQWIKSTIAVMSSDPEATIADIRKYHAENF
ncbi:MAG: hypothetical protein II936_03750 [Oscillospiraceae bacterium]|nr:hypothetical protein [Oscillospiraceae bacterium]MBQ9809233.1 hypothetical protein [Ruminococcus sp.]